MGERLNCKTGAELSVGDRLSIDRGQVLVIQGFGKREEDDATSSRIALVTIDNGSIARELTVYEHLFYQLCGS